MIDGIKFGCPITQDEYLMLKNKYEFSLQVNHNTGVVSNKEITEYLGLKLTIIANKYCIIQGSIHKAFSGGVNYTDFNYSDVIIAVAKIESDLNITAERFKIQRIEFGVNIRNPILDYNKIFSNAITYKGDPFNQMKNEIGIECEKQRFKIKIYDKSRQEGLNINLIRIELKIIKSEHLKQIRISSLFDITDKTKMELAGNLLVNSFKDILMDNDKIDICKLSEKEKKVYLNGRNPKFWKHLKIEKRMSTYISAKKTFTRIIDRHTKENLTNELQYMIAEKWNYLIIR